MFLKTVPLLALAAIAGGASARAALESDLLATSAGDLRMTFVGHASLVFAFAGKIIYIDPCSRYGDYAHLPPADAIFVTHEHFDHLDPRTIGKLRKPGTIIIASAACQAQVPDAVVMTNGESRTVLGIPVTAVPACNLIHRAPNGDFYHPRGRGNGYLFTFGDQRVYVAGDTENTPEMKALTRIDVAFLPMNLPYTMMPAMVADAARAFKPRILYPYHYGETDPTELAGLLKDTSSIEVRIRKLR